jgi:hypothetical protein
MLNAQPDLSCPARTGGKKTAFRAEKEPPAPVTAEGSSVDRLALPLHHSPMKDQFDADRLYEMCLAHIAAAILTCQTLESALRDCVEHWFPHNAGMEREQLDSERMRLEKATLGRLLSKFGNYEPLPDNFHEMLLSVLRRRNKIAHNFFIEFVNSDSNGKWHIIFDCVELTLDARFCRKIVNRYMIDAQIIAFERTSDIFPKTSDSIAEMLRQKKKIDERDMYAELQELIKKLE